MKEELKREISVIKENILKTVEDNWGHEINETLHDRIETNMKEVETNISDRCDAIEMAVNRVEVETNTTKREVEKLVDKFDILIELLSQKGFT